MTTTDMLREITRGATSISYDPQFHAFNDAELRAAGARVEHVHRDRTPTKTVTLSLSYPRRPVAR